MYLAYSNKQPVHTVGHRETLARNVQCGLQTHVCMHVCMCICMSVKTEPTASGVHVCVCVWLCGCVIVCVGLAVAAALK